MRAAPGPGGRDLALAPPSSPLDRDRGGDFGDIHFTSGGLKLPLKQMGKLRLRGHSSAELTAGLPASRDTENGGRLCQVSKQLGKGRGGPTTSPSPSPTCAAHSNLGSQ